MSKIKLDTIASRDGTESTDVTNVINGSAKAWVNFKGTGTVEIRESFNVSSITDNATGDYTVNFTNSIIDANYSISGAAGYGVGTSANTTRWLTISSVTSPTTSSCRVSTAYSNGGIDDCLNVTFSVLR
jgi:hypothetical protein